MELIRLPTLHITMIRLGSKERRALYAVLHFRATTFFTFKTNFKVQIYIITFVSSYISLSATIHSLTGNAQV